MSTFLNVNWSKYFKAELALLLQRRITVTRRKMYTKNSGKIFKQNIL